MCLNHPELWHKAPCTPCFPASANIYAHAIIPRESSPVSGSMEQEIEPSSTSLHSHPVVCSEPPPVDRDEAFKDLLMNIARKMDRDNCSQLAYAAECNSATTALDVLRELENKGTFCARSCGRLEELLRRIERCDLAETVVRHRDSYPDQRRES